MSDIIVMDEASCVPILDWEAFISRPVFKPYIPLIMISLENIDDAEWQRRHTQTVECINRSVQEQLGTYLQEEGRDV
jgi:hypothetical protein